MMLTFGPFLFDAARIALFAGLVPAVALALIMTRWNKSALSALLFALLAALLAARLAYVALHGGYYLTAPLEALKLYKGGFLTWAGVAAFLACLLVLQRRSPSRALPLLLPGLAGLTVAGGVLLLLTREEPERQLPALALQTLDGRPAALGDFAGRPLVVNLWASWCPPCRQEMPVLQAAQDAHPEVAFVYLNQGEPVPTIAEYLEDSGLQLAEIWRDPHSSASKRLPARALPTTLFVDEQGRIRDAYTGELTPPRLRDGLRRLR